MDRSEALRYAEENAERFRADLDEFLRIPSVSARPEHAGDVRRAAEFVAERLRGAGLEARLVEGNGHALVRAERRGSGGGPTVLLYGHHDVQPVDPLDLWETPPFEPTVVDGMIRARGGADDKGPALAQILALECWLKGTGDLPVDVVVLIEGEEECGGEVLVEHIREHREELAADALVIFDNPGFAAGVPSLAYGLRGICALEVRVDGPSRDLTRGSTAVSSGIRPRSSARCSPAAGLRTEGSRSRGSPTRPGLWTRRSVVGWASSRSRRRPCSRRREPPRSGGSRGSPPSSVAGRGRPSR
jgi:acetylornithine deacetylase/succinyl-diaminopimelate desuccinylase-like protein